MRRPLEEALRSQCAMLARRGEPAGPPDEEMRALLMAHVIDVEDWLRTREDIAVLFVSYNRMVSAPRPQAERLARCLGGQMDVQGMADAVDGRLYRQRAAGAEV